MLGYDGASFIEIECKIVSDTDWKIMIPRTTLRTFNDVVTKSDEINRSRILNKDQFTKTINDLCINTIKMKLEQPFEPKCEIGFNYITINHKIETLVQSPQKVSIIKTLIENEEPVTPLKSPKKSISSVVSEMASTSPNSLKLFNKIHLICNDKSEKGKEICRLITKLGGTHKTIPKKMKDKLVVILGDIYSNDINKSQFPIVDSDWVVQCFKEQRRLPLSEFTYRPDTKSTVKSASHIPFSFLHDSDEEMEEDVQLNKIETKNEEMEEFEDSKDVLMDENDEMEIKDVLTLPNFLSEICVGFDDDIKESEQK